MPCSAVVRASPTIIFTITFLSSYFTKCLNFKNVHKLWERLINPFLAKHRSAIVRASQNHIYHHVFCQIISQNSSILKWERLINPLLTNHRSAVVRASQIHIYHHNSFMLFRKISEFKINKYTNYGKDWLIKLYGSFLDPYRFSNRHFVIPLYISYTAENKNKTVNKVGLQYLP